MRRVINWWTSVAMTKQVMCRCCTVAAIDGRKPLQRLCLSLTPTSSANHASSQPVKPNKIEGASIRFDIHAYNPLLVWFAEGVGVRYSHKRWRGSRPSIAATVQRCAISFKSQQENFHHRNLRFTGVSVISMSRAPVNGLNRELLVELERSLAEAQDERRRGVVLTSSLSSVFSAGLDIMEMFRKDAQSMSNFWGSLQDLYLTLYGLSVPIAAAINGSSPAGGCFLAMCCEYRVFVDGKHTIGLNETNLGIVAPKWFQDVMIATIGHRNAELALLRGTLFSPQEALRIGLVDELATDKADAISKCENYIASFAKIPATGRYFTKLGVRQELIQWLHDNREADLKNFLGFAEAPEVQKNLELYVKSLKKR